MAFSLGSSSQPQQTGGLFGSLGQNTNQQAQQSSGGLLSGFGQSTQQQSQQQATGLLSGLGDNSQQKASLFGGLQSSQTQSQQQPHQVAYGQTVGPQQQPPQLQLGQSQQKQPGQQGQPSLWEEGRGLGVYRTIPAQILMVKDKWDPNSLTSPLRTYLYQVADEQNAPFYQPGPGEDEHKWEEAVSKRPGPGYVPSLARGFWDLGKRTQRQREFIERINIRLHDINQSLDAQLQIHSQQVASRLTECRRKHAAASQRTLALAAKIQILRNRGYVLDNAEEELKFKLTKLEKEIFDPSLYGREQEIWARMLGIRERGKRLQTASENMFPPVKSESLSLDENAVGAAKKGLEAYEVQLWHLEKETKLVSEEYEDWKRGFATETRESAVGQ